VTPVASVQNRYDAVDRSEAMVDLCEHETLMFLPWASVHYTEASRAVLDAARRHGVSPRQVVLARSPRMLPIPGSGSPEHVAENVAAAGLELSPDEVTAITTNA